MSYFCCDFFARRAIFKSAPRAPLPAISANSTREPHALSTAELRYPLLLTVPQVLPHRQRTERAVGYVEVREHLQLHHLVGDIEEGLGIHGGAEVATFHWVTERRSAVAVITWPKARRGLGFGIRQS